MTNSQPFQTDKRRTSPGALFGLAENGMKARIKARIKDLFYSPYGGLEAIVENFALWWGFWVLSPWWSTYDSSPTFAILSGVLPSWVAGGLPMAAAIVLLIVRIKGKQWSAVKHAALFFLIGYFLFIGLIFGIANIQSTAWLTYISISFIYLFILFAVTGRNQ